MALQKNIADRVRIKIYNVKLAEGQYGRLTKKEERLIAERVVKEYGGIKIYGQQDEEGSSYDIFGIEDYVFIDRSLMRLEENSCSDLDWLQKGAYSDEVINKGLSRLSGLALMRIKLKCLNLSHD